MGLFKKKAGGTIFGNLLRKGVGMVTGINLNPPVSLGADLDSDTRDRPRIPGARGVGTGGSNIDAIPLPKFEVKNLISDALDTAGGLLKGVKDASTTPAKVNSLMGFVKWGLIAVVAIFGFKMLMGNSRRR